MISFIKGKEKYILASVVSILLASAVIWFVRNNDSLKPSVKMSSEYGTYEELIGHSPIAVIGSVISGNKEFKYDGMRFAVTEVRVRDYIRGEGPESIRILQTRSEEDPYLKKGTEVLLFLHRYEGPIEESVYVINGLYHGQYEVKDNVLYERNVDRENSSFLKYSNLERVLSDIRNTEFTEYVHPTYSEEEIEEMNRKEKEMESGSD